MRWSYANGCFFTVNGCSQKEHLHDNLHCVTRTLARLSNDAGEHVSGREPRGAPLDERAALKTDLLLQNEYGRGLITVKQRRVVLAGHPCRIAHVRAGDSSA